VTLIGSLIRYVPNARTNVLKLKSEFIPGLADTVRKGLWMMIACSKSSNCTIACNHLTAQLHAIIQLHNRMQSDCFRWSF